MAEPIEIRPGDIIPRPLTITGAAKPAADAGGGFSLKNIKGYIDQIKEAKELLDSLGIDLGGLGVNLGVKKKENDSSMPDHPAPTGGQQIRNFLKLLQARYGDITVNELLKKLVDEFGDWKISNFTKGGLV